MPQLDPHAALIYTMVIVSAADGDMDDNEMKAIGETVRRLPAFKGFDENDLPKVAQSCASLLAEDDGFETVLQQIRWRLDIDRLTAAAIERGSRARHQTV
jgi:tellurite resistance protein